MVFFPPSCVGRQPWPAVVVGGVVVYLRTIGQQPVARMSGIVAPVLASVRRVMLGSV
jgi:hypothetical protein